MRDAPPSEDDSSLLVLILDTNPFVWYDAQRKRSGKGGDDTLSLEEAVKHILVFLNAYLALKHENRLAVIANHVGKAAFMYPLPTAARTQKRPLGNSVDGGDSRLPSNEYQNFKLVDDHVIDNLRELFEDVQIPLRQHDKHASMIAGALSLALCYINKTLKDDDIGHIKARICVLSVSADCAYQYIPVMNCIFSAQKMSVPIDVCKLFDEETVFLQQAAHLTGGIYQQVEKASGLLQHLLFTFLRDQYTRTLMVNPSEDRVDFRAACFCHKRIVDVGHVCSVCLSIFCSFFPVCATCRTEFAVNPSITGGSNVTG